MHNIRSFIAIPLAPDVQRAAVRLIKRLSEPNDGIKWVPTDNLHLTLKFLGDVDNTEVPRVCDVLREVCEDFQPFDLHLIGTGGFPVGLLSGVGFDKFELTLAQGDRILILSDGVTECPGPDGEMLDEDGLIALMYDLSATRGPAFLEALIRRLSEFNGSEDFPDDVSAILFEYQGLEAT